jgi:hypothetical protein
MLAQDSQLALASMYVNDPHFLPAGLSLPHFEQGISSPLAQRFAPYLSPCPASHYHFMRVKPSPSRKACGRSSWSWR